MIPIKLHDLTDRRQQAVINLLWRLPDAVDAFLYENGVTVHVARRLRDIMPRLRRIRLWGAGGRGIDDSVGHYSGGMRMVSLARECLVDGEWTPGIRWRHTLYHELGHALDDCLAASRTRGFSAAFYEDTMEIRRLGKIDTGLAYFARLSGMGRLETAAECLAWMIGDRDKSNMSYRFQRTFDYLEEFVVRRIGWRP